MQPSLQFLDDDSHLELIHGDAEDALSMLADRGQKVDLVISSPPYNIRKPYERGEKLTLDEYVSWQARVLESCVSLLTDHGSVIWQVGNYVERGATIPLDILLYPVFAKLGLRLRNRIIWRFNFGLNADRRFSGRYETLMWFTKADSYLFNLDPVRIPQIYPGKKHALSKGGKGGTPSGNPLGKNPSDFWEFSAEKDFRDNPVWEIPNVKANHPEKTAHPCQFPIELAERCVLALSPPDGIVLDPFVGTGSSCIAAIKHNRRAIGIDKESEYLEVAQQRVADFRLGILPIRPLGKPIAKPRANHSVSTRPEAWQALRTGT